MQGLTMQDRFGSRLSTPPSGPSPTAYQPPAGGFQNYTPTAGFNLDAAVPRTSPVSMGLAQQSMQAAGNVPSANAGMQGNLSWMRGINPAVQKQLALQDQTQRRAAGAALGTRLGRTLTTAVPESQFARMQTYADLFNRHRGLQRQGDSLGQGYDLGKRQIATALAGLV